MVSNEQTARIARAGAKRAVLGVILALLVVSSSVGVVAAAPDAGTTVPVAERTGDAGVATTADGSALPTDTSASIDGAEGATVEALDPLPGKRLAAQASGDVVTGHRATVTGQVFYEDDGSYQPARHVKVELVDKDLIEKSTYDVTYTNDRGEFTLTFDATEPDWGSSASVIVKVYAENPAAEATTGALRNTYTITTDKFTIGNGETKDFGQFASSGDQQPWQAIDWALDARREIADRADGWTRDQVRIQYPQGDGAYASSVPGFKRISLPDSGWDENTVHHEYGHTVMDTMYDGKIWNWPVPESDHWSGCHVTDSETDEAYAWIEGWAEFHEGVVADDATADGMNLERRDYYDGNNNGNCFDGDSGDMDGHRVEGSAASILWDLYDGDRHYAGGDDDGLTYSLDTIYAVVDSGNVGNVNELWDAFRTDATHEELRKIYFENGIVKPDRFEGETPLLADGDAVDAQISTRDVDTFAVDLEAGEKLTVDLSFDDSNADLELTVEGPGGNALSHADSSSDDEQAVLTAQQDGRYTIEVADYSGDTAPYTLEVSTEAVSDDDGDYNVWTPGGEWSGWTDWSIVEWIDLTPVFDGSEFDLGTTACTDTQEFAGHVSAGDRRNFTASVDPACDVEVRLEANGSADLDLYVSADGRIPTLTDFDRKSTSASGDETIRLDAAELADDGRVTGLVHAYNGESDFVVVVEEVESND